MSLFKNELELLVLMKSEISIAIHAQDLVYTVTHNRIRTIDGRFSMGVQRIRTASESLRQELDKQEKQIQSNYKKIQKHALAGDVFDEVDFVLDNYRYLFSRVAFGGQIDFSYSGISNEWQIYYSIPFVATNVRGIMYGDSKYYESRRVEQLVKKLLGDTE